MTIERLQSHLGTAIEAASLAGASIMSVYRTGFMVERKDDRSPVTLADREAHRIISEALTVTGLPVLSEEGIVVDRTVRQEWSAYWLVDPLDGTREFVKRNGEFTVNIALMERCLRYPGAEGTAAPVAGVLFAPVTGTLYFAWQGGGAYRQFTEGTPASMSAYERALMSVRLPLPSHPRTFTILASRSHRDPRTEAFIRAMETEHGTVTITGMGSALKFGRMAEGAADVYPRTGPTMEWDTAAGQLICEEAGLSVTDMGTGVRLHYNKHDLMNGPFIVQ